MKTEGLIGIIVLGLMCLVGITLIFLDSSIPILAAIVLGAIFSLFVFLGKEKKTVKLKDNRMNDNLKNEFRIIAQSAENAVKTANDIKEELYILKKLNNKYVASVKSKRFHRAECRLAKNINENNKVYFSNKIDALKNGFVQCRTREI